MPSTILEAMTEALDQRLAKRAPKYQVHYLLQQRDIWASNYAAFMEDGNGLVHPTLGPADAWDYATFLTVIDERLNSARQVA